MNVLRTIRRGSAVAFTASWTATLATAVAGAVVVDTEHLGRILVAEILFGATAVTATLVYVIASLTAHIDDTQWAVGYSDRLTGPNGTNDDSGA